MPTSHVAEYKKKVVEEIIHLMEKYPIIGALNMQDLPASALQKMRAQLRSNVEFAMTKRRIMKIAIEKAKSRKPGIEKIEEYLVGMPALLFTHENPFTLFKTLKKNKSPASAKAGQIAPRDIIVQAGPTSFAPGPIIAELSGCGIKAGVEGGKVAIKQDSLVAKQGEKFTPKKAEMLARLGITPMEIGLDLVAVYENGVIYQKSVLDIDETEFINKLRRAASGAFNLSMYCHYPAKGTIKQLIGKAYRDAKALGLSQNILEKEIVMELLAKAEQSILRIKAIAHIPDAPKTEIPAAISPAAISSSMQPNQANVSMQADMPNINQVDKKVEQVDKKVEEMVKKMQDYVEGKIPTAEKILDEIKKDQKVEKA